MSLTCRSFALFSPCAVTQHALSQQRITSRDVAAGYSPTFSSPFNASFADIAEAAGLRSPVIYGDRERGLRKAEAQPGRDRDCQDAGPRALAYDRRRLARGRREGARVHRAVHNDQGKNSVSRGELG